MPLSRATPGDIPTGGALPCLRIFANTCGFLGSFGRSRPRGRGRRLGVASICVSLDRGCTASLLTWGTVPWSSSVAGRFGPVVTPPLAPADPASYKLLWWRPWGACVQDAVPGWDTWPVCTQPTTFPPLTGWKSQEPGAGGEHVKATSGDVVSLREQPPGLMGGLCCSTSSE